jgi:hypothetical protein
MPEAPNDPARGLRYGVHRLVGHFTIELVPLSADWDQEHIHRP